MKNRQICRDNMRQCSKCQRWYDVFIEHHHGQCKESEKNIMQYKSTFGPMRECSKCQRWYDVFSEPYHENCEELKSNIIQSERLTIEEYGCMLSLVGKGRSEDHFTHTSGVAISKDKRVLGISYNGLKAGMKVPEWMKLEENREKKSSVYLHAEDNLFSLVKRGECYLLCLNLSPCIACCRTIAANEVKKVVFLKKYHRCDKYKEFFEFYGIECYELPSASKLKISNYMANQNNFEELK